MRQEPGRGNNYKVLNTRGREIETDVSLHPGEILVDELEARNIKKIVFAARLGMKAGAFFIMVMS